MPTSRRRAVQLSSQHLKAKNWLVGTRITAAPSTLARRLAGILRGGLSSAFGVNSILLIRMSVSFLSPPAPAFMRSRPSSIRNAASYARFRRSVKLLTPAKRSLELDAAVCRPAHGLGALLCVCQGSDASSICACSVGSGDGICRSGDGVFDTFRGAGMSISRELVLPVSSSWSSRK